jgi:hypothetical protein
MAKNKRTKRIDAWVRRHTGQYECACGCGQDIIILRKHYSSGIPNFIKGHNMQGKYNPKTENQKVPDESLWDRLDDEEKARRLAQLKNFPKGEDHPNWAGGKFITDSGYRYVLVNDHPYSVGGYLAEHRLEVENLVLMESQSTHLAWHSTGKVEDEKFNIYQDRIYCPWIRGDNAKEKD